MGTQGLVHRRACLPLVVLALLVAGCGIDEDVVAREAAEVAPSSTAPSEATEPAEPDEPAAASPFAVEEVPDGYELLVEGAGEAEPDDDAVPLTVLGPDGAPTGAEVVFVEAVPGGDDGFEDAEGERGWDSLTRDGHRAWAIDAEEDALAELLDGVEATEPGAAPVVEDPPDDLEVAGSITAEGVLALRSRVPGADDPVPGPVSAHTSVWTTEDGASLVVMAVPEGAVDPAVVVTEVREPRRVVDHERDAVAEDSPVGDETGVITTTADAVSGAVVRRELTVETAWGDVLLVISRGAEVLDADELVAVAESVTEV